MKNINTLLNISLIAFLLVLIFACDDDVEPYVDSESVDCEWCFEEVPEYVDVELLFNLDKSDSTVIYTVFTGLAFASEVYFVDTAFEDSFWVAVLPDQKYTVVAKYTVGEQVIHVVNDCFVKTEYFKYACEEPCYYVHEASCDLKLK